MDGPVGPHGPAGPKGDRVSTHYSDVSPYEENIVAKCCSKTNDTHKCY